MKNSTLLMVGTLAAISLLSAALAVVPMQQASAQDTIFKFKQEAKNKDIKDSLALNIQSICLNLESGGGSCRLM
jgi:hypothetical protein